MAVVKDNSDLLIQQYKNSPNLKGLVDAINCLINDELFLPALELSTQASLLTAEGVFLDRIGEKFGILRPFVSVATLEVFGYDANGLGFDQGPFTDETGNEGVPIADDFYRSLIIARGGQLLTDGSVPSMNNILTAAFGSGHYIDNQNMTMDVRIDGDLDPDIIGIVTSSGLITKPSGVRLINLYNFHDEGGFGFDNNGTGFDQAPFVNIINLEG